MLARGALLLLVLLLEGAPLHAEDICGGGTIPHCFDAGDPDMSTGTGVTRNVAADDFQLTTDGQPVGLRVDFWTVEADIEWDGTLDYYIFEDVPNPASANGRGPASTPIHAGQGKGITREATGRVGTEVPLIDFVEYEYSFRLENKVSLNSGQVYWLGLHLSQGHSNDLIFWETTRLEAEPYPPGVGYGSTRHYALNSVFENFTDSPGSNQQLAFEIYENPPHVPSVSTWNALAIAAALLMSGAAVRRRAIPRA